MHVLLAPLQMQSAEEVIRFAREFYGAFNQIMAELSRQERESIWDEVVQAMQQFEGPNGFEAPREPIVGVGVKPQLRIRNKVRHELSIPLRPTLNAISQ